MPSRSKPITLYLLIIFSIIEKRSDLAKILQNQTAYCINLFGFV
ncbi:hypothetical protein HD_0175 [[Haemophilus] ducreyi 35000HP]|uniref:Uncharacterized protein n=1 Tax=Haemophilus ducreyi (strain 35000HP / ATCC 700724) TaxID=233412 RepID=Q7VPB4_HAEDU|nr:hypothetical protein HD_0175 [[Haemophilus] ducreyi 35000HP]